MLLSFCIAVNLATLCAGEFGVREGTILALTEVKGAARSQPALDVGEPLPGEPHVPAPPACRRARVPARPDEQQQKRRRQRLHPRAEFSLNAVPATQGTVFVTMRTFGIVRACLEQHVLATAAQVAAAPGHRFVLLYDATHSSVGDVARVRAMGVRFGGVPWLLRVFVYSALDLQRMYDWVLPLGILGMEGVDKLPSATRTRASAGVDVIDVPGKLNMIAHEPSLALWASQLTESFSYVWKLEDDNLYNGNLTEWLLSWTRNPHRDLIDSFSKVGRGGDEDDDTVTGSEAAHLFNWPMALPPRKSKGKLVWDERLRKHRSLHKWEMVERLSCTLLLELHNLFSLGLIGFGEYMSSTVCNSLDWCSWQDARLYGGMRGGMTVTGGTCGHWIGPIKFRKVKARQTCRAAPHPKCSALPPGTHVKQEAPTVQARRRRKLR